MSEKCRLCLKIIPSESAIKLYHFLPETIEAADMVNLIAKYLNIKVKKDDIVSTTICQDCNDHLEEFHKFSDDVAAKQLTLQNDFLAVDFKKECSHFDDNAEEKNNTTSMEEEVENKVPTAEQAMFEYPIDVKDELDSEKDTDELCVQDMLEADLNEIDAEEYKPPDGDMQSSEVSVPIAKIRDFYNIWLTVKTKKASIVFSCFKTYAEKISGKQLNTRNLTQIRNLVTHLSKRWRKSHRIKSMFEAKNRIWLDKDFGLSSDNSGKLKSNASHGLRSLSFLSCKVAEHTRGKCEKEKQLNRENISIQDALSLYIDMDLTQRTYNMMSSVVNQVHEDCFPPYPSIIEAKEHSMKDEDIDAENDGLCIVKSESEIFDSYV